MSLSICSIIKNEAEFLPRMLESIFDLADQIIINDTGSTDNSKEVIFNLFNKKKKIHLLKFYETNWENDFSQAKNFCIEQADSDWLLFLDADEELINPQECRKYLQEKRTKLYKLPIYNLGDEQATLNFKCALNTNIRLFPKKMQLRYQGRIHEFLAIKDSDLKFETELIDDFYILHHGYKNKLINQKKTARNIVLLEKSLAEISEKTAEYYHYSFLLGRELFVQRDYPAALKYFELCLQTKISEVLKINVITFMAKIFANSSQWSKLKKLQEENSELALKNPDFCLIYGAYLQEILNNLTEAQKYYLSALQKNDFLPLLMFETDSITWKPYFFMGISFYQQKKWENSLYFFQKAAFYSENIWQVNYYLVLTYYFFNNKEIALEIFLSKKNIFPEKIKKNLEKQLHLDKQ